MGNRDRAKRLNRTIQKFANEISFLWEDEALDGGETESIAFGVLDELDRRNGNIVDRKDEEEKYYAIKTWIPIEDGSVELYNKEEGEEEVAQLQETQPENIYRLIEAFMTAQSAMKR